jgi:hypothetical protein
MLGKVEAYTGVSVGHLVTMSPSVIVLGRVESELPYSFSSFFLRKGLWFSEFSGVVL